MLSSRSWSLKATRSSEGEALAGIRNVSYGVRRSAPRAGFVWSQGDSRKTIVRGGIGVFYDSVPLDVYAFKNYPNQIITTYDAQGLPVGPPVRYLNITAEAANSTFPFIERRSKSGNFVPYSTAWNLEFERTMKRWLMRDVEEQWLRQLWEGARGEVRLQ